MKNKEKEIMKAILGKSKSLECSDSCHAEEICREITELLGKIKEVKRNEES